MKDQQEYPVIRHRNIMFGMLRFKRKRFCKRCSIIALLVLLMIIGSSCQKNQSNLATNTVTEKPTPETIKVKPSLSTDVGQDQPTLNITLPDTIAATISTGNVLAVDESVSGNGKSDVQSEHQSVTLSFYDASNLKGRGLRDYNGEPDYVNAIGYAAVYMEANLENSDFTSIPWTVPVYIKNDNDTMIPDGTIDHGTKIGIISQKLKKQNGREYEGYLEYLDIEAGRVGYINVKNFVTVPYWNLEISKAVSKGYGIATFRQTSQYIPVNKDGESVNVKKDSQVLLPAWGTYYVSTMERVDYQIAGIIFDTTDNKPVPQYVFFNKADLKLIY